MTDGVTTVVSYYSFGGLRIAVKRGNTLYHLHGDHLGSTSLTTRGSSETANRADYAYCAERSATGDLQTDYTFTGQKRDATGLMYYNARYYDPALGTSVSPDSLIPVPKHAISFNRFLYAKGHPLKFTDPGGHCGFSQQGKGGTLRISEYDCTVDDFDALSWDERVLWLDLFVEEANLQEWFHDIRGVITDLFIGDEAFENREGFIAYMDAAILQA